MFAINFEYLFEMTAALERMECFYGALSKFHN